MMKASTFNEQSSPVVFDYTEDHKIDIWFPYMPYLYAEDMDEYELGTSLAIALRLITDQEDEKLFFDFEITA